MRVKKAVEKKRLEKKKNRFNREPAENTNKSNAMNRIQKKKLQETKQIKENIAAKNKPARAAEPTKP